MPGCTRKAPKIIRFWVLQSALYKRLFLFRGTVVAEEEYGYCAGAALAR